MSMLEVVSEYDCRIVDMETGEIIAMSESVALQSSGEGDAPSGETSRL